MNKLKLNNKIEIIKRNGKKTQGIIHDIVEELIIVGIPSDDKEFKLLNVGEEVNCISYSKDCAIGFYGKIKGRCYQNMPTYTISNTSDFQRIQRRRDVRIPISIDVLYTSNEFLLKMYEKDKKKDILSKGKKYLKRGMVSDISAGGIKFSCYSNFPKGCQLLLSFKMQKNNFFIKARILHKEIKIVSNKTIWSYGVVFEDISEIEKEGIVRNIFIIMRKRSRKNE